MKAAVLEATQQINICDLPIPHIDDDQVLVRVHYTGICGSDVPRALEGRVHSFPLVLGHEFSGAVKAVGTNVEATLVGQRVAGVPLVPCGVCSDCATGNYSLCKQYSFIGSRQQGSMAQYVVVPATNVFQIDDAVSDLEATFFEPTTVALHAILLAQVKAGDNALVIGGGTIGILLAQALEAFGANPVVAVHSQSGVEKVKAAGFQRSVVTTNDQWINQALDLAHTYRFDHVFDAAGTPETIRFALKAASSRSTVCFVGTPKHEVSLAVEQWEYINRKELTVLGSWMSYSAPWPGREWDIAARLFANNQLHIAESMIEAVYPLSQTAEAFVRFKESHVRGKVLIDSWEN